jgi:hypothetical protein
MRRDDITICEVVGKSGNACEYCSTPVDFVVAEIRRPVPEGAADLGIADRDGVLLCPKCGLVVRVSSDLRHIFLQKALLAAGRFDEAFEAYCAGNTRPSYDFESYWIPAIDVALSEGLHEKAYNFAMRAIALYKSQHSYECERPRPTPLADSPYPDQVGPPLADSQASTIQPTPRTGGTWESSGQGAGQGTGLDSSGPGSHPCSSSAKGEEERALLRRDGLLW